MPRTPAPLPRELCDDVYPLTRVIELGVSAERIRRRDVDRPYRGVVARGFPLDDVVSRAVALSVRRGMPEYGFSHLTGAAILRLPLPRAVTHEAVHVTVRHPHRAPRLAGVRGHAYRLTPRAIEQLPIVVPSTGEQRFLPVLSEPWLFSTLASMLTLDDLVVVADAIRTRAAREGRTVDLRSALAEGRLGSVRAARALAASVVGARSRPESLLRLAILRAGLPAPSVGHSIKGAQWTATPDLAWPAFRVLVEYEGDHHRTDDRQFTHDLRRFERYGDAEWVALRATKLDLFESPNEFLQRVEGRLRQQGWRPGRGWRLRSVSSARP